MDKQEIKERLEDILQLLTEGDDDGGISLLEQTIVDLEYEY